MAQPVIDEWSSSPTRCDRARHWMVARRRPPTAGSRRPDRRWRSGHGEQVAIARSEGTGPAGAQSGEGSYPQCPQDQAPVGVCPVYLVVRDGQANWRIYPINQNLHICTIQIRTLDIVVSVVCPVDLTASHSYCMRISSSRYQSFDTSTVQVSTSYGYATGVFSSRKLEQATYDSVAFRYITGDEHPDHDTIANFRKRFLGELEGLFKQVLEMAAELGTLRLGRVSLDGTKVQGNASKHKAMSWGHANKLERQLEGEVQTLLEAGAASGPGGGGGAAGAGHPGRVAAPRGTAGSDPGSEGEDRSARARAVRGGASGVRREVEATAGTRSRDWQEGGREAAEGAGSRTER